MKHWVLYAGAIGVVAALSHMPFSGTDVGKLKPVELICVSQQQETLLIETDTGEVGRGDTLDQAFSDLKAGTAGNIFLETADYLLVSDDTEYLLRSLTEYLRPACKICSLDGPVELEEAAAYLSAHEPELTLQDLRAGEHEIPVLKTEDGGLRLVS